ncbi:MAG: ABC transporter substrate-binding protein [Nitrospira sp.]|nr:ABC transporter substrate-binding protein [Nitrospira sp.]
MGNGLVSVMRKRSMIIVECCILCLFMMLAPRLGLAAQTPTEAVQVTMKDLLYLLTELKETSRSAQRQWEIEQVVRRAFNYEEMAERALGEGGEKTTVADRRQFTRLFVQVLRDDLADKLRDYSVPQVDYLSEQGDGAGTQVLVAPAGREVDTRIEFHVVQRSGRWLVNDVSIDGASIVATYHAQFSRILREGSFLDLMEFLKQKAVVA